MLDIETIKPASDAAFLRNPYCEWAAAEGVPVVEDFGVDLFAVPMKPWPRFGANGAIVHLKGRGDFISVFRLDIPPGGKTAPQRHLFEEVVYVLSGYGSTALEVAPGVTHRFEWGPGSLFALPLNVGYRHFNGSGAEPARLASTNNLCVMMNLFCNADFVFDNPFAFPNAALAQHGFTGDGDYVPAPRGRVMWETNFVPDLHTAELLTDPKRGKGAANQIFLLADGRMHAHCSHMPVGTYKKAHRHGADYHVLILDGEGFSLFWYEGDADFVRINWREGWMFAPPDQMYHQHFNTAPNPSRYMATAIGNSRYPFTEKNRLGKLGVDVDIKAGGSQIEYQDQDPRVHAMYLDALAKNGVVCRMTAFPQSSATARAPSVA